MFLNQIEILNFRNYPALKLEFSPRINIIFGKNAQGKTNLLEAVALFSLGRSFRTKREEELIRWGSENCFLRGQFESDIGASLIEIGIGIKEKKIKLNGQNLNKNEIFSQVPVVIFSPDDLLLIKGGPIYRRDFLDLYLAQIDPKYRYIYYNYYKILQQRNRLLKRKGIDFEELEVWNDQLVEKGAKVIKYRLFLIESVKPFIIEAQGKISGKKEDLIIEYQSLNKVLTTQDESEIQYLFSSELKKVRSMELERGTTLIGPQLDDLNIKMNHGVELKKYGSQGQQRTASLALKLGLIEKIKETRGVYPVLLLDDVMSEFDDHRKQCLIQSLINSVQTFMTSTSRIDFPISPTEACFFEVRQGEINHVG
ncbi:MAG: DNA replication/repair protein RecF [Firmicutes bacterium]|nr:DNA replication/repair protein RecF [Bacillota bacterium]